MSGDKSSGRRHGEVFRRYVNVLAHSPTPCAASPSPWALACSDLDDVWLTDEQFDLLAEIGNTIVRRHLLLQAPERGGRGCCRPDPEELEALEPDRC